MSDHRRRTAMKQGEGEVQLPAPETSRWQPLRSGLLNLYLFEDEEFHYAQGRLLLRGNNGTGKSRVLALQLPFLLDGEVHPHRVEPDGDPAKRLEWHLLMNGRYPDRIGYSWVEFGRLDVETGPKYCTLGIGMQAIQGRGAPSRWYFLTDRRVREDLHLMTPQRTPLTRPRLEEQLGDRGAMYSRAQDYRDAVDRRLFRLGRRRYGALVDLLIQLRRPQLSRRLDEEQLNRALSDAMPPLGDGVLGDVAEAFRGLETDRDALGSFREAARATARFMPSYRRYARIATRRRAEVVRRAHSRYESTLRSLRDAGARAHEARRDREAALDELGFLKQAIEAAAVEIRTLEASDEMRSARELDRVTVEAERRSRDAKSAEARLEEAQRGLIRRELDHAESCRERRTAQTQAAEDLSACEARAVEAGLHRSWKPVAEVFAELLGELLAGDPGLVTESATPRSAGDALARLEARAVEALEVLRGRVDERLRASTHLESRLAEVARARERLVEHRREQGRLGEELADAQGRRYEADVARDVARDALIEDYRRWARDTRVLAPMAAADLEEDLVIWAEVGHGPGPVATAVAAALDAALARLHEERVAVQARIQEQKATLAELEGLLADLRSGRHQPPPTSPTRDPASRADRVGAPLWALCEFVDDYPRQERAGLEAALEGAGLLDAWLTPTGEVDGPEPLDTWLGSRGAPVSGPTLADRLRPLEPGDTTNTELDNRMSAVGSDQVNAVLRRIGLGSSDTPVWVAIDGRYRLGPARGVWRKEVAQHIGASAREADRRRRIAKLEAETELHHRDLKVAQADLVDVKARVGRSRAERDQAPQDDGLRDALAALVQVEREVIRRREALEASDTRVQDSAEEVSRLSELLTGEAEDLGLVEWLKRLPALRELILHLQQAVHGLRPWVRQLVTAAHHELACARREDGARGQQAARQQEADVARGEVMRAESERRVLEETVGARVEDVIERLQQTRGRDARLRKERTSQQNHEREADRAQTKAEAERRSLQGIMQEYIRERDAAVLGLSQLVETGLLRVAGALGDDEDADETPGIWSPTRAVELARWLEQRLAEVDIEPEAWDQAKGALHRRIAELETELGIHGWRPRITERDELRLVTVTFQSRDRSVDELGRLLAEEVAQRERLLAESERQVIENHLIDEVSAQIHERLREGEALVARMNTELDARPTSTGMRLRFGWEPRADDPQGWRDARKLLLATQSIWSPVEREAIGRFLQQRIEAVRMGGQTLTWREQLAEAFDYRRWHTFVVSRFQDGTWQLLTRRTHGTSSGGEKALALTLPQLAAAAAHYGGAHEHAPRLILLDEAFVGVDRDMRGQCMGLVTAFDLDFVMTSEREWGCYATVPALAIYQLSRHPDLDAIHTTRWVWNGRERRRGDEHAIDASRETQP